MSWFKKVNELEVVLTPEEKAALEKERRIVELEAEQQRLMSENELVNVLQAAVIKELELLRGK